MSLLLRLNKLLIGVLLLALPAEAYIPDTLDYAVRNLNETQKFLIRNGQVVPYNKVFVRRVVVGKAKIMPNGAIINLPHGPDLVPSFHDLQHDPKWQVKKKIDFSDLEFHETGLTTEELNFYLIHALDVYSTVKGLEWDCIYEQNPLLPNNPSTAGLIAFKVGILSLLKSIYGDDPAWDAFMKTSTYTTGTVVLRNFDLTSEARKDCNRR